MSYNVNQLDQRALRLFAAAVIAAVEEGDNEALAECPWLVRSLAEGQEQEEEGRSFFAENVLVTGRMYELGKGIDDLIDAEEPFDDGDGFIDGDSARRLVARQRLASRIVELIDVEARRTFAEVVDFNVLN